MPFMFLVLIITSIQITMMINPLYSLQEQQAHVEQFALTAQQILQEASDILQYRVGDKESTISRLYKYVFLLYKYVFLLQFQTVAPNASIPDIICDYEIIRKRGNTKARSFEAMGRFPNIFKPHEPLADLEIGAS
eukprot:286172_1